MSNFPEQFDEVSVKVRLTARSPGKLWQTVNGSPLNFTENCDKFGEFRQIFRRNLKIFYLGGVHMNVRSKSNRVANNIQISNFRFLPAFSDEVRKNSRVIILIENGCIYERKFVVFYRYYQKYRKVVEFTSYDPPTQQIIYRHFRCEVHVGDQGYQSNLDWFYGIANNSSPPDAFLLVKLRLSGASENQSGKGMVLY